MIAGAIYILCCCTSVVCAALLLRGYRSSKVRLLLWSGLCFVFLAVNNVVLFIDLIVVPDVNLMLLRDIPTLTGLLLLLFGMIWDTERS